MNTKHLKIGPTRDFDGLPEWVEWKGERFHTPDYEVIEQFVTDSVADSLDGEIVEPDGYDYNGYPSWLLVLGLI